MRGATRAGTGVVTRSLSTGHRIEMREVPDGTGGSTLTFTGYASVTETPYEMADMFGDYSEVISRGAFAKTLAEGADVPFKLNHAGMTLARTKSGTMDLSEDETGLHVEARFDPKAPTIQDIRSAMERGDLDEMSFGFRIVRQEWSPDYMELRISEVNLNKGDVSLVNYGANPATGGLTSLRSLDADALAEWRANADPADVARMLALLAPADDVTDYLASLDVRSRAAQI